MFGEVKAKCKKCGRQEDSNTLVLDPVYKMMVCRDCVKERKEKEQMEKNKGKAVEVQEKKPAGWDSDDERLQRAYSRKAENAAPVQVLGSGRVKYKCQKCKYPFVYDRERQNPKVCPYCGTSIPKFSDY
jgi:hypothetical protein